jgi:sugar-specific transcriptional regulator TrmB
MEIPLLTNGEARIYQTLVELGESSIGNVIKISKVSHSKVYDVLKRLSEKGLVSSINKNGRQYFSAAEPERLSELVAEEKERLQTIQRKIGDVIRQLGARKNTATPVSVLSAYEGMKGMKSVIDSTLDKLRKNDEILILGSPRRIGEHLGGYLKDWQRRRLAKGVVCKLIVDVDAPSWSDSWWTESKKKKRTFSRRSKLVSPAYIIITKGSVATVYFSSKILAFIIEHEDIAKRYREFFDELWKVAV